MVGPYRVAGARGTGVIQRAEDRRPSPEEAVEVAEQEALGMRLESSEAVVRALQRAGRCRDLKAAISKLSAEDQELIRLRYRQGMTIRHIASHLGISSPSACNKLKRVRARLRVLVEIPEITPDEIRRDLTDVVAPQRIPGYDPVEALAVYYETMNQCETAARMGVNQSRVSYTVRETIRRVRDVYRLRRYRRAFSIIVENKWRWSRRGE
jgi:DNA-directed RNA polymerase specialized sigma24 family protein